ncbi:MAG: CRISPR-associated endonuclease Cas1 [Anaerolineae bacterium]
MTTLYIKEQGAMLRRTGERLVVTKEKEVLEDIPILHVTQVVVMGNVQVTTPAVALLLQRDVDVVFLSSRGKYRGRLMSTGSRYAELRHAQLQMLSNTGAVLGVAKAVVDGKLANQRALLQQYYKSTGTAALQRAAGHIERARQQARHADNVDSLRGYEGTAGAAYFGALKALIPQEWGFVKRIYHPPPDPINALLSLGYTLLLKDMTAAVQVVGLDPFLGFFHVLDYGRPSLTLDLMETFRPLVDAMVLDLVLDGRIQRKHFALSKRKGKQQAKLEDTALQVYLRAYEAALEARIYYPETGSRTSRRRCMELQARELAQVVLGKRKAFRALSADGPGRLNG